MDKATQLVGSSNFIEWNRIFTRGAKDKDVWALLNEEWTPIATEPDMDDEKYRPQPTTLSLGEPSTGTNTIGSRELRSIGLQTPGRDSANGSSQPTSIVLPDTTAFVKFQHDHAQWEKGQKKIKVANTLIKNSVSPIIAGLIRNKDDPVEAYKFLKEKYKVSDTVARQKLLGQLKDTTLNKFKFNVENYVNRVFEVREDLKDYKKELPDEEVAEYLLAGLPHSYKSFKEKYDWLMRYQGKPDEHDLQALTDELLKEGTRRDKAAKAKKAKSNNNNSNNGSGNGTSNTNNNSNKTGSGEAKPKCDHCGKVHHVDKCWKLHPELIPQHIKKKIQQANANKSSNKADGARNEDDVDDDIAEFSGTAERVSSRAPTSQPWQASLAMLAMLVNELKDIPPDPQTYQEAMAAPDAAEFIKATHAEIGSLEENDTFDIVDAPLGVRLISSRFVYKRKYGHDGRIKTYKVRLVARGFQQREGIDYDETFAAVVRPASFRILFALAVVLDWFVHQMNFKTAFLNGDLEKYVYMKPPRGWKLPEGKVWRVRKSLYGLKQSPRTWWNKLTTTLVSWGWRVGSFDPCVFIKDEESLILCLWVDDILLFGSNEDNIKAFKKELSKAFKMTDEGHCKSYLGIHVDQQPGVIHLHQAQYVEQMLKKYGFTDAAIAKTPGNPHEKLRKQGDSQAEPPVKLNYQSKVGTLNYGSNQTRPDISFTTGLTARYASNPGQSHMDAVSQIFQYLKGTKDVGILYRKEAGLDLKGFVDSDFGNCEDSRKSTTGYIFTLAGGPVEWKSKRQDTVAMSTMDAEYIAAGAAATMAIWIRNFINDLRIPGYYIDAVPLYIDNNAALKLTRNPEFHSKSKHIDIKHHFIREKVIKDKILATRRVGTKDNIADLLTKSLARPTHELLMQKAGLGRMADVDTGKRDPC